jgi:hypothetical protein
VANGVRMRWYQASKQWIKEEDTRATPICEEVAVAFKRPAQLYHVRGRRNHASAPGSLVFIKLKAISAHHNHFRLDRTFWDL